MAKKKVQAISKVAKIGNEIVIDLTEIIKKGKLPWKGGDKLLCVRINSDTAIMRFGESVTKEMKQEEYIMSSDELSKTATITEIDNYANGKKERRKAIDSTKEVAFQKATLSSFYEAVKSYYHISDRMVRRYISRGLMPPPERYGKKAFYDEARSNVYSYLNVIDTFKKCYNLSLDEIEVIINRYRDQIIELDLILADIEDKYNNPKHRSPYYVGIRKRFLEKIQKGKVYLEKLNIKAIEKEIKRK